MSCTTRFHLPLREKQPGTTQEIPLLIDSDGYRREISGTSTKWVHSFDRYKDAIHLIDPEGYAAFDFPHDRQKTLTYLSDLEAEFPNDDRLWPAFSVRWTWDDHADMAFQRLPGWVTKELGYLIPLHRQQRKFKKETRENWGRAAIANALKLAVDPDFQRIVEKYGKAMLGGMVRGPIDRLARVYKNRVLN